jgi:hypothetical protein
MRCERGEAETSATRHLRASHCHQAFALTNFLSIILSRSASGMLPCGGPPRPFDEDCEEKSPLEADIGEAGGRERGERWMQVAREQVNDCSTTEAAP